MSSSVFPENNHSSYPGPPPLRSGEWLAYYRWVSHQVLTVTDVETTGGKATINRLTEISVLQGSLDAGIIHQHTSLINAGAAVPWFITRVTGISQDMVDTAPPVDTVLTECLPYLSQGILTAHNLAFDYSFLQTEYKRLAIPFTRLPTQQLCTVVLARLLLPDLPSRSLPDLVQHFQFPIATSHRAEADTLACWLLAKRLLTDIQQASDRQLLARFAHQWIGIKTVAAMMNCTQKQANLYIEQAGIQARSISKSGPRQYQRGDIEQILPSISTVRQH